MKERFVEIPTQDGQMETFVTHPEQDGPFPPVVIYMDVWGVRGGLYDLARRVATVGYYCMVPDFYYRQGRIRSEYFDAKGRRISLDRLSPEDQSKVLTPLEKLSNAMVVKDTGAILEFLRRGEPVKPQAVGAVDFCMGGRHVMAVAGPSRSYAASSIAASQSSTPTPRSRW